MPKKGNAFLDGTVHVGKEVQTIQRYKGTVHVGKEVQTSNWNRTCEKMFPPWIWI